MKRAFPQEEQDSTGENYCSVNCCSNLTHSLAVGMDALQYRTLSYTKGERKEEKKTNNNFGMVRILCMNPAGESDYFKLSLYN